MSTAPNFVGLRDVTFIDERHGWMLSDYELPTNSTYIETLAVDTTINGGQSWQTISTLYSGQSTLNNPNQVTGLRFVNAQDGWAYGPDLLATYDGGKTWNKEPRDGDVRTLTVTSGTLWLLETSCRSTLDCTGIVRTSPDNGQTWQSSKLPAEVNPCKLVAADNQTAWVLYNVNSPDVGLLVTDNGGKTWKNENAPEGAYDLIDLAASDSQNLWFTWGNEGATDLGAKHIFNSSDGGKNWRLVAKTDLPPEADDTVTPVGAIEHLYAFSRQSAWITLYRNAPIITNDGGKTWLQMDYVLDVGDLGNDRRLTWIDSLHIWYYSDKWLFHTIDGGSTWMCQRMSSGYDGCYTFASF